MLHPQAHIQTKVQPARLNLLSPDWSAVVYRAVINEHLESLEPNYEPEYVMTGVDTAAAWRLGQERVNLLSFLQLTLRGRAAVDDPGDEVYDGFLGYLGHLRSSLPALSEGEYRPLLLKNDAVYGFVRETSCQRCYVLLNFGNEEEQVELKRIGRWIAGTHEVYGDGEMHSDGTLVLTPYEGRLYELRRGDSEN